MAKNYTGMSPAAIKEYWLEILEGDDPDEFQIVKELQDGHVRGDAFKYKQGMHAALKGEGASPLIQDQAFHDGHKRMTHAMVEKGIHPLPPDSHRVLALPVLHTLGKGNLVEGVEPTD